MKRATPALVALLLLIGCRAANSEGSNDKPEIYLLTSLPLLFDEQFGLEQATGEAATFLRERYRVRPIDLPSQLPAGATLFAAQPRALPAEQLVALDEWVRNGGRMVLLADPMLEWPSKWTPGDRLRPPLSFADTGLLLHWGLRLDAPDQRGPVRADGRSPILFLSPGRLVSGAPHCRIERREIEATCRIGRGTVIIVADADWLNQPLVTAENGAFENQLSELANMIGDSGRNAR